MKQLLIISMIAGIFLSVDLPAFAYSKPATNFIAKSNDGAYKNIATMKLKEFQKLIGRKLTLKEKIGFFVLKHKMKHQQEDADKHRKTALIWGLVGLGLFLIGLIVPLVMIGSLVAAVIAIVTGSTATKKDGESRKVKAGKVFKWIMVGLIALVLIVATIVLTTGA